MELLTNDSTCERKIDGGCLTVISRHNCVLAQTAAASRAHAC
jgi:hypothetical protein